MLRTLLRDESNEFRVVEDPSAISDIVQDKNRLLWLDLQQPTLDEFAMIREEFRLHPLAIEDAMARHQRPKVDQYEHFYLVIFYAVAVEEPGATERLPGRRGLQGSSFLRQGTGFQAAASTDGRAEPAPGSEQAESAVPAPQVSFDGSSEPADADADERIVLQELTLFLGENYLITVHDHPVRELEEAARRWSQNVQAIRQQATGAALPGTRKLSAEEKNDLHVQPEGTPEHPRVVLGNEYGGPPGQLQARASAPGMGAPQVQGQGEGQSGVQHKDIGILLYSLLDSIVDNYFPVVDSIVDRVEMLEEQVFQRFNQAAIETIFRLKKDLLALRRVLAPERDVLNVLTRRDLPIFDSNTVLYFQDVYDHVVRVTDSIDTYRDLLSSALDSYLSMQSNRLNITVQTLTSASIILMSVSMVTGWYGMNFEHMPELHTAWGYPVMIALVSIIVVIEVIFFKRRRWL